MTQFLSLLSLVLAFATLETHALPLPRAPRSEIALPSTFSTDFDFEGIAELSNCSGSLVQFEHSQDTDMALLMTNGHCIGAFIPPNEYIFGRPSSRSFELIKANGTSRARVSARELVYATMTKTDVAIYKLAKTYAEIKNQYGIRPFTLAREHSTLTLAIDVVSGYWMRGYRCQVEAFVHRLKEGDWTWEDSLRYSRPGCEVIGGTSGSPIVARGTRTIVGINNTGNENGGRCTDNNPCEIDENGDITYEEGYSYGQQILWIYSCLNAEREVDLTLSSCLLPK